MSERERVLCSFGPFGTSVCRGPYGMFTWHRKNTTRVVLTDTCLRGRTQRGFFSFGRPSSSGPVLFEVPYTDMCLVRRFDHPARLGLMDVLEFTFQEGAEHKVLTIAAYKASVARALGVLRSVLPAGIICG